MTKYFLSFFLHKWQDPADPEMRSAMGAFAGAVGILCNLLLTGAKLAAGFLAGSVSVLADAVNNLMDAASSMLTLLGFRLAQRPADREHPFGHARYEYLSGLAVAVLILVVGVQFVRSSVEKILRPKIVTYSGLTAAVLFCAVLLKLWMTRFYRSVGKKIGSVALDAAAADSRNDALATAAVLLGCGIQALFSVNVDGYMGLAVALFICWSGITSFRATLSPLLGPQAGPELTDELTRLVQSDPHVLGVHDLLVHDYGPGHRYASLHAELSASTDPLTAHESIDAIEQAALTRLNVHLVIHYDPVRDGDAQWDAAEATVRDVVQAIDPQFTVHDFHMTPDPDAPRLIFDVAIPYDTEYTEAELIQHIQQGLAASSLPYPADVRIDRVL